MCFLQFGIRLGQCGPRFAQPEAQLTEHPLALADPDADTVLLLNPSTECFSIPEVSAQACLPRRAAQNSIHRGYLFFTQASGAPRPLSLQQPGQAFAFKTTDPVLHRPCRIPEQAPHLGAGHALRYQKHTVKAMIISRFFRATDLVLKSKDHRGRVCNRKWFHSPMKPRSINIRNYLCRYVELHRRAHLASPNAATAHRCCRA